jgi:hypothetical protein
MRKSPVAEDRTRATSVWLGSRRIAIVARYGLSQTLPGRSTGQVGPILTSPVIPESGSRALVAAEARDNPRPLLPQANVEIDIAVRVVATVHLVARTPHIMNPHPKGSRSLSV